VCVGYHGDVVAVEVEEGFYLIYLIIIIAITTWGLIFRRLGW
jgi:hypothetical protein